MCINGLKWICYLYYICSMYIFIYYFLIVFKNKTLNTSFWRVGNIEYVNQSASISIKNVSILDLPVGVFTPQSLIYFGFVIYEVARWLICHLIRIGCYDPSSINGIMCARCWTSPGLGCCLDALGHILSIVCVQDCCFQERRRLAGLLSSWVTCPTCTVMESGKPNLYIRLWNDSK